MFLRALEERPCSKSLLALAVVVGVAVLREGSGGLRSALFSPFRFAAIGPVPALIAI
jgi:hypothetical protein